MEDYNKRLTFMSWKSRKRGEREQVEKNILRNHG